MIAPQNLTAKTTDHLASNLSGNLQRTFWKDKRVLVTGHTGFKGSWLVALLNHLGAETHGIALPPDAARPSLYALGVRPGKSDLMIDIRDSSVVTSAITKMNPEIVFHLAAQALVLPSYEDPIGTFATNVMGTAHVAMACLQAPALKVLVNITSDKCYENREWAWAYRESDPMGGHDPYSASKGAAEIVAASLRSSFFDARNIALPSMRAGNVIGGGDWAQFRIVPDLVEAFAKNQKAVIRSPDAIRPWQHVLEPLRAYLLVAEKGYANPKAVSKGWNIGPDPEAARDVLTLASKAAALWSVDAGLDVQVPKDKKHEATFLKLDSSQIKQELGWRPLFQFEEALKFTIDWYRDFHRGGVAKDLCERQIEEFLALELAT